MKKQATDVYVCISLDQSCVRL